MKLGSLFAPVHQGHQELIGSAQFGRPSKVAQGLCNHFEHQLKGFSLYSGQTFEFAILQLFDRLIVHVPIMAHLSKRSIFIHLLSFHATFSH